MADVAEEMSMIRHISSTTPAPNWTAARAAASAGEPAWRVLCALLGCESPATEEQAIVSYAGAMTAQCDPIISIYARDFTAHIATAPGVSEGQVYAELRDYSAARAVEDPAMREVKRRSLLALLDQWQAEGPPSAEDDAFWRDFQADLVKTKSGAYTEVAVDLERQLAEARERIAVLEEHLAQVPGRP